MSIGGRWNKFLKSNLGTIYSNNSLTFDKRNYSNQDQKRSLLNYSANHILKKDLYKLQNKTPDKANLTSNNSEEALKFPKEQTSK